ncbi:facilitated trehalose transporter Tret1-like [Nesidiocoris tenuis]|uniref:Facilitated trehalose transporter Tret1-like n=1 Tax=Nesidiocoris tenuis TaxID=355587 RepID=A0ABN7AXP6_9HEMI|nr:facilitated trehalose transporter Tret1-like [Nesidiocoris tenuis]
MLDSLISFGRYGQYVSAVTGSSIVFISGLMCCWPAAVLPKITDGSAGFRLEPYEQSWMVAMLYVGSVLSPVPGSYVMDKVGRKGVLLMTSFMSVFVWIILLFAKTAAPIYFARFLCGVYCGVEYTTVANFVAESVEPKIRGRVGTLMSIMFSSGAVFVSLVSFLSYTAFTLVCLFCTLIVLTCFLFVPETPYFYLMHGRRKDAERSVTWLRGSCSPTDLDYVEDAIKEQLSNPGSYLDIFRNKASLKAFVMVEIMKFISACSSSVFLMTYAPILIPDNSLLTSQQSYILLSICWLVTGMCTSAVMDSFERRTLMLVSCFGALAGISAAAVWYYLRDFTSVDVSSTTWLPLVVAFLAGGFEVIGLFNIPNIYKGEIFAINIKSKACALSCVTACFFEGVNTYLYYPINENIGEYFNFVKSAITTVIGIIFTLFFMIETRGKSLEAIQDILNNRQVIKEKTDTATLEVKKIKDGDI